MASSDITIFTVEIEYEYEQTIRDEFGWVEGHGPGNGRYKKGKESKRVIAPRAEYANEWVKFYYSNMRNVVLLSTVAETIKVDAIIKVE